MSAKKKSSGAASTPKGDREAGLNPPIPFVPKKLDDDDKPPTVEITILKDPDKAATKDNTEKKEFPAIETFTGSGATTVIVLKRLQTEVYEHLGIANDSTKVADRLDYLLQVTTGRARDQLVNIFKQGRQQFADAFEVVESTKRAFVRDKKVCFEWLLKGNKGKKGEIPEETLENLGSTAHQHCSSYETYVWFEMGKLLWTRHQTVQEEHIRYLVNKIIKPFDMAIRDFYDRVVEMYSYIYYMQPPSMNNQAWYEAKWSTCVGQMSEERTRTAVRNGLPRSMQDKLDQKDEDYRMVSIETFLDYLYRLETEDKQERAEKQRLKDSLEKKGNFKAAEAVESGKIPKKDKRKSGPSAGNSHNQPQKSSQKDGKGKYCTLCAAHGKEDRFIHSHNADQCRFKDEYEGKLTSGKHAKKTSKSGSGRSINMLKKEQKKIKKVVRDEYLTAEEKQRRINQILDGGSSRGRSRSRSKKRRRSYSSSSSSYASDSSSDSDLSFLESLSCESYYLSDESSDPSSNLKNIKIENSEKAKSTFGEINSLDKIINNSLRSNEILGCRKKSSSTRAKVESSVDGKPDGVPKPMVFVNIYKGKTNLSLEHRRLVALVDPGFTHSIVKRSFVKGSAIKD